ncbi:conserved hypothetical protein [Talaromyces stipitatus ATCC 10500]|uniref:Integral membrane protein n=1 Tax=Talaromyces stipitatus (strain ATCC 10500 / CBS 375.48 / QM 6759 / NRRL 1006) TaxID=441959 RepID=B8MGM1_TALSN|nr:uncharacterized protein TSTA_018430 [Talaromyces stipitatus ATCC 10500]EED16772.1 conserved hypothetical protein [Talaromyces stipitatus ATCC 10500]
MKYSALTWVVNSIRLLLHLLVTTSAGKTFLASVFLFTLTFGWCKVRFWRDPHSAFFDDTHVYDLKYSLTREHEARQFISAYNAQTDGPPALKASPTPVVCVAVTTVKRDGVNYLDASVGSLLAGLYPQERSALSVNVLFADTDPRKHPSWEQQWLNSLVDSAASYNVSNEVMGRLRELEESRNYYEKGVYDYVYVLERCLQTNTPYIAIFEDDIIAADGWLAKSLMGLSTLGSRIGSEKTEKDWLYMRLFYTETSLSWSEDDFWYRNMPLAFLLMSSATLVILLIIRRVSTSARRFLNWPTIAVICLVSVPAFTGLVYMTGKYNVMPLQGVVEMNKHGCCTQGMIFPRDQVPDLIRWLEEHKSGQTDTLIEEYADSTGLRRFAYAPPQLQHVGSRSSRDNLDINTRSTWAFWFEENDPRVLAREHESLVQGGRVPWI